MQEIQAIWKVRELFFYHSFILVAQAGLELVILQLARILCF